MSTAVRGGFLRAEGAAPDPFDTVEALALALRSLGHRAEPAGDRLFLDGLALEPLLLTDGVFAAANEGVRTVSVVNVGHPTLFPTPVFEYQHATGDNLQSALYSGFRQWAQLDLVPILDALRETPATCATLVLDLPASGDLPARKRRVVLGPVMRWADAEATGGEGHEPGCPCCLLTNTFDAFRPQLDGVGPAAVRMFAMRGADGEIGADCRIDGVDHPAGMAALRAWAATWPGTGFDSRKQYLVFHDV